MSTQPVHSSAGTPPRASGDGPRRPPSALQSLRAQILGRAAHAPAGGATDRSLRGRARDGLQSWQSDPGGQPHPDSGGLSARMRAMRPTTRRVLSFSEGEQGETSGRVDGRHLGSTSSERLGAPNFDPLVLTARAHQQMDAIASLSSLKAVAEATIVHEKEIDFHQRLLELLREPADQPDSRHPVLLGAETAAKWRRHVVAQYGGLWAAQHFQDLEANNPRVRDAVQAWVNDELALAGYPKDYDNVLTQELLEVFQSRFSASERDAAIEQFFRKPMRAPEVGGNGELESLLDRLQDAFGRMPTEDQRALFQELLSQIEHHIKRDCEHWMSREERQAFFELHCSFLDLCRDRDTSSWHTYARDLVEDLDRKLGIHFEMNWASPRSTAETRLCSWAAKQAAGSVEISLPARIIVESQNPARDASSNILTLIEDLCPNLCNDPEFVEALESLRTAEDPRSRALWNLDLESQLLRNLGSWPQHNKAWKLRQVHDLLHTAGSDGSSLVLSRFGARVWLVLLKLGIWQTHEGPVPRLCQVISEISNPVMNKLLAPTLLPLIERLS